MQQHAWRHYLAALLPLSASATPLGKWNNIAYADAVKDNIFCKVNVAVVEGLDKDPLGTAYCSRMLDIPMATV